jgi:hypothetical protein
MLKKRKLKREKRRLSKKSIHHASEAMAGVRKKIFDRVNGDMYLYPVQLVKRDLLKSLLLAGLILTLLVAIWLVR